MRWGPGSTRVPIWDAWVPQDSTGPVCPLQVWYDDAVRSQPHRGRPPCSLLAKQTSLLRLPAAAPAPPTGPHLSGPDHQRRHDDQRHAEFDGRYPDRRAGGRRSAASAWRIGDKAEIHGEVLPRITVRQGGRRIRPQVLLAATSRVEGDILHEAPWRWNPAPS